MENFRTPNFELVADLLDWLLHRYGSTSSVPDDISTEQCRIHFLTTCCKLLFEKTNIKCNPRKLYGADGYAVKELLRVAQMLYDAQKSVTRQEQGGAGAREADMMETSGFSLSSKLHDLKSTRSLCSAIVESGATLHHLLQQETQNREDINKALRFLDGISRNLDSNSEQEVVERSVTALLSSNVEQLQQRKQSLQELQKDEKNLETKIKKKKQELDRCTGRLTQLTSVRPAFMDEYEKLEEELAKVYESYVSRFRNLDYLEYELDQLNREEESRMEQNARELKRLQKRLREEEWRMLRGDEDGDVNMKGTAPGGGAMAGERLGGGAGGPRGKSQVVGSMIAVSEGSSEEKSDDGSSDAISVGKSEGSDHPLSISGSDEILEQSDESDVGGGGLRDNDHNF
eukprot:CAMPEP_0179003998 /NCGR_PEP_ID=MMETSP0795-20121207/13021_1 /TAXON_ID=88552 /ORGANISM="Amoebophrya sp., Strain Ameob2" /LENGTH=400 /DNA_ID=CAMNT_0020698133 /DNA_START=807 /DNA_END=2009 /DNA_ORIENTATION=+